MNQNTPKTTATQLHPSDATNRPLATVSSPVPDVLRGASHVCAYCDAPLVKRRSQTRYCGPTCRVAAYDERHNRTSHAAATKGSVNHAEV